MARRAEITQEGIDLAALALFAQKGVDRTTINDIASSAGIARQDLEVATAMVLGIVLQPATFKVYGRIDQPMTALADHLAEACWMALKPAAVHLKE